MTMHASEREDAILKLTEQRGPLGSRELNCRLPDSGSSQGDAAAFESDSVWVS